MGLDKQNKRGDDAAHKLARKNPETHKGGTYAPPIFTAGIGPQVETSLQKELAEGCHDLKLQSVLKRPPADLLPHFARYHDYLTHLPRRVRRALQRRWKRSLSALALLLALGQAPALAASIDVTTNVPDINPSDGFCSLIEAIDNANADAQTHTDCAAESGPDIINLPAASTHTLTAVNSSLCYYDSPNGLPFVSSAITIEGNNGTITRAGSAPAFRILCVKATGDLTLKDTTVSGGVASNYGGGGVYNFASRP